MGGGARADCKGGRPVVAWTVGRYLNYVPGLYLGQIHSQPITIQSSKLFLRQLNCKYGRRTVLTVKRPTTSSECNVS